MYNSSIILFELSHAICMDVLLCLGYTLLGQRAVTLTVHLMRLGTSVLLVLSEVLFWFPYIHIRVWQLLLVYCVRENALNIFMLRLDSRLRVVTDILIALNHFGVVALRKLISILEWTLSLLVHRRLPGRVILGLDTLILVDINKLVLIYLLTALVGQVFGVSWILQPQM